MFKNNCDFKSRFRILKGGKISLMVSALLIVNTAQAQVYTIDADQATRSNVQISENSTINVNSNITVTDAQLNSAMYVAMDGGLYDTNLTINGTVSHSNDSSNAIEIYKQWYYS